MASTLFVDGTTPVVAAWLNDVNNYVYGGMFPSNPTVTGNFTVLGTSLFNSKINETLNSATPATLASSAFEITGSVNNYLSMDIRNASNGSTASSDFVATADTGTDTTNYVDFGINGSGNTDPTFTIVGALGGYLYSQSSALAIGTGSASPLQFFIGGTLAANERARFSSAGNFLIGSTTDASTGVLQVTGTSAFSGLITATTGVTTPGSLTTTGTGTLSVAGTSLLTGNVTASGTINSVKVINPSTARTSVSASFNTTATYVTVPFVITGGMIAGQKYRVSIQGSCTSTAANTSTISLLYGPNGTTADTSLLTINVTAATSGTTNPFNITCDYTVQTVGSSGTGYGSFTILNNGSLGIAANANSFSYSATTTLANNVTGYLGVSFQSSAATTSYIIYQATVELVR